MVLNLFFYSLCASFVAVQCEPVQTRLVDTTSGSVRGYKDPEGELFVFYNIPYATVPTGENKFKAPFPAPIWEQPLDAVDLNVVCPQHPALIEGKNVKEDCLIANVFVPNTLKSNLPVVVYVHGGAFLVGFGNLHTPKHLVISEEVIVVTFNYRLGVHGFLCFGTEDIPGNAGMKDQVTLLRWVKDNIVNFGGNPDDVTLAGYSAGSVSVDLLQISPMAQGLFNKVILESGSNLVPWAVQYNPIENAKHFAKLLNFTKVDDITALKQFYKTASFETLTTIAPTNTDSTFGFVPCIENDLGEERFLSDDPDTIIRNGFYEKLPILGGFSNSEGLFRIDEFETWKNKMNEKFSDFLPINLHFGSEEEKLVVAKEVKEFYFGQESVSESTVMGYVDFFTDVMFALPTIRSIRLQEEIGNNNIFLYEYSFVDDEELRKRNYSVTGADHCGQTHAVQDGLGLLQNNESDASPDLKQMKDVMRKIWGNFIKNGVPMVDHLVPNWPAMDSDTLYMSLDTSLELRRHLLQQRATFWDGIYKRYYRKPQPPKIE